MGIKQNRANQENVTNLLADSSVIVIGLNNRLLGDEAAIRHVEKKLAMAFAMGKLVYFIIEDRCDWNKKPFNRFPVLPSNHQPADSDEGLTTLLKDIDAILNDLEKYLTPRAPGETKSVFNGKRVLVVGTGDAKISRAETLWSRAIGHALAGAGYGLISGGWPGVDAEVVQSYQEELKKKGMSEEKHLVQILLKDQYPIYKYGTIERVANDAAWYEAAVKQAFAVIIIGGKGGTWLTYKQAEKASIPVIPITATGGDAKKVFQQMFRSKNTYISRQDMDPLDVKITNLQQASNAATQVIKILKQVEENNPSKEPSPAEKDFFKKWNLKLQEYGHSEELNIFFQEYKELNYTSVLKKEFDILNMQYYEYWIQKMSMKLSDSDFAIEYNRIIDSILNYTAKLT